MTSPDDNSGDNGDNNIITGKLLIVRHQQSDFAHNAAIAAANAIQEPGMCQFLTLVNPHLLTINSSFCSFGGCYYSDQC